MNSEVGSRTIVASLFAQSYTAAVGRISAIFRVSNFPTF